MKNLLFYYFLDLDNPSPIVLEEIEYQIKISLALGWNPKDILLVSNKKMKYDNIRSTIVKFPKFDCGKWVYKLLGLVYIIEKLKIKDIIWYHDCDLIQIENLDYKLPEGKDIGILLQPLLSLGCIFFKDTVLDLFKKTVQEMIKEKGYSDERYFKRRLKENRNRFDSINPRYNIGKRKRLKRYQLSKKPIIGCHFKFNMSRRKIGGTIPIIAKQAMINSKTKKIFNILKTLWEKNNINYKSFIPKDCLSLLKSITTGAKAP